MIGQIEQKVFFNLTRVLAWIILIPACIALVYYGIQAGGTFFSRSQSPQVTYDEVKERMSQKDAVQGSSSSGIVHMADQSAQYEKKLKEIVGAFGPTMDRQKGLTLFRSIVLKVEEKDRNAWLDGMLNVARSAPEGERFNAADQYIALWEEKKLKKTMEETARAQEQSQSLILFTISFAAVAMFSLMLILLAIEKNTRRTEIPV